ncbi:MAG TPA: hypothetical protein VJV23_15170 [Candidatus Polarisedimenticolia bacterium]|nr:hypothetical protein [Candidatus Polarisedimenticolia bacterium]
MSVTERRPWAIVLASGREPDLASALACLRLVASPERTVVVVRRPAAGPRWSGTGLGGAALIEEPADRGSAPGALAAALVAQEQDPAALVALVRPGPAVEDRSGFLRAWSSALALAVRFPSRLVAVAPCGGGGPRPRGGRPGGMVMAGVASVLLETARRALPGAMRPLETFRQVLHAARHGRPVGDHQPLALASAYARMQPADLERDLLAAARPPAIVPSVLPVLADGMSGASRV